ncbi:uncharacterized protein DDB_G0285291-like [Salvelinus alpinus]|uniref:uncharacterized protein DDB_G0285291-like n=1 Tax=Salvelinus alpinus TaxID=8036 RepID=UPI0039FC9902
MPQQLNQPPTEPQKELTSMPQQVWYRAKMLQQQNHLAAMPQMPLLMWHPAQFPQQELAVEPQQQQELAVDSQQELAVEPQQELAVEPQQVRYPAQMPQQQPNYVPQQLWHVAQMPQQQLVPMSLQKHYESTEDGASSNSQFQISSKSHYENGRTVFSQTRYTPREAMPVDSGNAPNDSNVGIFEPSTYPPLVKDPTRNI